MAKNAKKTSAGIASKAAKVLQDPASSKVAKKLAGSALAQANTGSQTGADMEAVASAVLKSDKYAATTKELAGSVMAQCNKDR